MLKLSKKADYGLIALKHLAMHHGEASASAADIAEVYGISATLMAKVLQKLARGGLVAAQHGSSGGYTLARDPSRITALDAITPSKGRCSSRRASRIAASATRLHTCIVRAPLRRVNDSILDVLNKVTISQMADETPASEVVELRL